MGVFAHQSGSKVAFHLRVHSSPTRGWSRRPAKLRRPETARDSISTAIAVLSRWLQALLPDLSIRAANGLRAGGGGILPNMRRPRAATSRQRVAGHPSHPVHRGATVRGNAQSGFTLAELIVSIGIIMVLIGLLMPTLANSYSQAKLTRDMSLVRQHAAAIHMYAADFGETYPYAGIKLPFHCARNWSGPMIEGGYFNSYVEVEPEHDFDAAGGLRYDSYVMSMAMVFDANLMQPGQVPIRDDQQSIAIRTSQVVFPSSKGLILRFVGGQYIPAPAESAFCCAEPWEAPVAFDDGSASSGTYRDFLGGDPLYQEAGIGIPVLSTWFGVRGRDR